MTERTAFWIGVIISLLVTLPVIIWFGISTGFSRAHPILYFSLCAANGAIVPQAIKIVLLRQ